MTPKHFTIIEFAARNSFLKEIEATAREMASRISSTPGIQNIDSFQSANTLPIASAQPSSAIKTVPLPVTAIIAPPIPSSPVPLLESNSNNTVKWVIVGVILIVVIGGGLVLRAHLKEKKNKELNK